MIAELYEDDAPEREIPEPSAGDMLAARDLVIRLRKLERAHEGVKATRDAVAATYDARLAKIDVAMAQVKDWLRNYVILNGTLRMPDVGTVFLTPKKPEPKVILSDIAAAVRHAEVTGVGMKPQKPAFSKSLYLAEAQRYLETKGGQVLPGIVWDAPVQTVVVKAA